MPVKRVQKIACKLPDVGYEGFVCDAFPDHELVEMMIEETPTQIASIGTVFWLRFSRPIECHITGETRFGETIHGRMNCK